MQIPASEKYLIWGLKSVRHSHRYIHQGFFETLQRLNKDVLWVDDLARNQHLISDGTIVIAADVAMKYLTDNPKSKYVLHNIPSTNFRNQQNVVKLQVYTKSAKGENLGHPLIKWDSDDRTLYQPWGLSIDESNWLRIPKKSSSIEYWVGAVWNNDKNQGNEDEIKKYSKSLSSHGFKFRKLGGTRSVRISGVSDLLMTEKIAKSPIGSAIVGNWQAENKYVPCRIFKNVASGKIPSSNLDLSELFANVAIKSSDYDELIENVLSVGFVEYQRRLSDAQERIKNFTYEAGIKRIISVF